MKMISHPLQGAILVLFSLLILASCSRDMEVTETPQPEEKLTSDEQAFLRDLAKVDKDMDRFWAGFSSVRETPIYIITQPDNGIFLNPPNSEVPNSTPIQHELGMGLENFKAYRNDLMLNDLLEEMNAPSAPKLFDFFDHNYKFMGFNLTYDLTGNFYNDYKNRNGFFHPSIFYHELFHCYHNQRDDEFKGEYHIQKTFEYPINDASLPLLLLLFEVMIDAYHVEDIGEKQKILTYYVSIQDRLNMLDTTSENLVRHHGFYQEKLEGIARYIEVFATLHALNNNTIDDPTHGFKDFAENITQAVQVHQVYAFRIFYHTGAGVIHLLKELDYPNLEQDIFTPENTPFDLAKSMLSLTDLEIQDALETAKIEYHWENLVERSNFLLNL